MNEIHLVKISDLKSSSRNVLKGSNSRRENKRVEFRKSKNLKFWTFRILKIINDRSLSTALKPMIQIHSENH